MVSGERVTPNLRKLARQALQFYYPGQLHEADLKELVKSVVSQWERFDGHAGLIFHTHRLWLQYKPETCQPEGQQDHLIANILGPFAADHDFAPTMLPMLARTLNLRQRVEFRNRAGKRLRMRMNPVEHSFSIEPLPEEA